MRERFGAPVRSKLFRFLHRLSEGTITPMTITNTASEIKSHKDPWLAGVAATATGALTGSAEVLAIAAGGVASGAEGVAASEDELAVAAGGTAAAAGGAERLRECARKCVG